MKTMDMKENTVLLSTSSYNQIKSENTKFNLFMDRLFEAAELRPDYSGIDFNVRQLEELIHLCYPDRYKKKLSTLRTQQTKMSNKKLEWERQNEG
jgi:hypothetical protein